MTAKEANEAARRLLPVIYDGMEFKRITQVGLYYNEKGEGHYFVQLLSSKANSVVNVQPSRCELKKID